MRMFKKVWFWIVVVILALAGGLVYRQVNKPTPPLNVQTEEIGYNRIVQTVTSLGRIQPKTQVNISADVSGKILHLAVKEGDWVEKGQLLLELEKETHKATVEQAEANLRSAQANANLNNENLTQAKKEYDRAKELFQQNLETQAVLDEKHTSLQVQKARCQSALDQVEQAKANLKQYKTELLKTTIYAPMSGTVSQLNKEEGEIALGSQFQEDVIMVLANMNGMEALVDVDENDIVNISTGNQAQIEIDALPGVKLHGTVTEIANTAKVTASGTTEQKTEFEVKISVTDVLPSLRPGMTASAEITTKTVEKALVVPLQSVAVRTADQLKTNKTEPNGIPGQAMASEISKAEFTPDEDGFVEVVFIIQDGVAIAKQVKTGIQSDTHIELLEGVQENDTVVTGNFRALSKDLQNGTKVAIQNQKS